MEFINRDRDKPVGQKDSAAPLELRNAGNLFHSFGPILRRVLQRKFPSLPEDTVDEIIAEAIVRASRSMNTAAPNQHSEKSLFAFILITARNRAIDHLRYSPRVLLTSPEVLERAESRSSSTDVESQSDRVLDLNAVIATLDPLDQRILHAAMVSLPAGRWAYELAVELVQEKSPLLGSEAVENTSESVHKLAGRLRVRKLRLMKKLRESLRAMGHTTNTSRGEK